VFSALGWVTSLTRPSVDVTSRGAGLILTSGSD
jgi:hypothetical protein